MKKTAGVIFLLFLTVLYGHSQNRFEGSIRWSVKADYADPAQAEKTKQLMAELSSPEGIKKMQVIEERMKDSTFKAYLEGNPALKAQMEQAKTMKKVMEQSPGEDPLTVILPKFITLNIKDSSYLMQMEGGVSSLIGNLLKDSTGRKFSIKEKEKVFSFVPDIKDTLAAKSKVATTKEMAKILNYNCRKYIVVTEVNGKTVQQILWTTTEIKSFDKRLLSDLTVGGGKTGVDFSKVEGVPLKMTIVSEALVITFVALEIKNEPLKSSLFVLPKGFNEVPFVKFGK